MHQEKEKGGFLISVTLMTESVKKITTVYYLMTIR